MLKRRAERELINRRSSELEILILVNHETQADKQPWGVIVFTVARGGLTTRAPELISHNKFGLRGESSRCVRLLPSDCPPPRAPDLQFKMVVPSEIT